MKLWSNSAQRSYLIYGVCFTQFQGSITYWLRLLSACGARN
jgi:hypothetical protein